MMNADIRRRCEAIARLEQQRKELAAEIKELKATAKADGYDVSLITKTVSLMLKDSDKQKKAIEQHELFDTYLNAVGLLSEPQEEDDLQNERDFVQAVEVFRELDKIIQTEPQSPVASGMAESGGGLEQPQAAPAAPIPPQYPTPDAAGQVEGGRPRVSPSTDNSDDMEIPAFLRRTRQTEAA